MLLLQGVQDILISKIKLLTATGFLSFSHPTLEESAIVSDSL